MIDVCFTDAVKAGLFQVKSLYPDAGIKSCIGLSFYLSQGDIASEIIASNCPRKEVIKDLFSFERYGELEGFELAALEFWTAVIADFDIFKSTVEDIRIWIDNTPDAICGMLFAAYLLKNRSNSVSVVEFSKVVSDSNIDYLECRGFEDFNPSMLKSALSFERRCSKEELFLQAEKYEKLLEINAPLRVVVSSEVLSVGLDYYDDKIRDLFSDEGEYVAKLVGKAMFLKKIPTNDVFIAKRIECFIASGELLVSDNINAGFYEKIVRRKIVK